MSLNFEISEVNVPRVDTSFGGFRIAHEIARGGMASVYLAYRSGIGGFVQPSAIKVIHPHMASDRGFVEMFVDEARIASCISHPNVCKVLDFGKAGKTFYLAMEYLFGETWGHTLQGFHARPELAETLPAVAAHVIAQACEGLHAAHEALDHRGRPLEIVHRDVSPQNLFVGYDGSVRVLDFGIAQAADRLHTTRNGTIKGRYSYMSPEQMSGRSVDRTSDIWSLGVVLREALTGRSVFRKSTDAETIHAVVHGAVPPWEVDVDPALQRIADRALQYDPEARYESAREMGVELRRFALSRREHLGMAEVSGLMQRLFAANQERKRDLVQRAARAFVPAGRPLSFPPPRLDEDMEVRPDEQTPTDPEPGLDQERTLERMESTRAEFDPHMLRAPMIAAETQGTTRVAPDEEHEKTLERLEPTKIGPDPEFESTFERIDRREQEADTLDPAKELEAQERARAAVAEEQEQQTFSSEEGETILSLTRPHKSLLSLPAPSAPAPSVLVSSAAVTERVGKPEPHRGAGGRVARLGMVGVIVGAAAWLGLTSAPSKRPIEIVVAEQPHAGRQGLTVGEPAPEARPGVEVGAAVREPNEDVVAARPPEVPAVEEPVAPTQEPAASPEGPGDLHNPALEPSAQPTEEPASSVLPATQAKAGKALRRRLPRRVEPAIKAAPQTTPQAATLGTVNVSSGEGWADVYEGERKLGSTPASLKLSAGAHTLSFRAEGTGPKVSKRVVVVGGQTIKVKVP